MDSSAEASQPRDTSSSNRASLPTPARRSVSPLWRWYTTRSLSHINSLQNFKSHCLTTPHLSTWLGSHIVGPYKNPEYERRYLHAPTNPRLPPTTSGKTSAQYGSLLRTAMGVHLHRGAHAHAPYRNKRLVRGAPGPSVRHAHRDVQHTLRYPVPSLRRSLVVDKLVRDGAQGCAGEGGGSKAYPGS